MEKDIRYYNTFFSVETIKRATQLFDDLVKENVIAFQRKLFHHYKDISDEDVFSEFSTRIEMSLRNNEERWQFDTEDEFFAEYHKIDHAKLQDYDYQYSRSHDGQRLYVSSGYDHVTVSIKISSHPNNRAIIERIFDIFHTAAPNSKIPFDSVPKPKIFIGHGRSALWRDLKDHLHDKHCYEIVAYEVGARAGHTIRDILSDMLSQSSFALLVLTAEDETNEGKLLARQNVVHETGLFQGKLGFSRAIVMLEEGAEEFSNIQGIEQLRFSKGNIKETFGDILAIIKREFY